MIKDVVFILMWIILGLYALFALISPFIVILFMVKYNHLKHKVNTLYKMIKLKLDNY